MSLGQRLKQGVRDITAFARTIDYTLAQRYLTAEQLALFQQLSHGEQHHALNVLRDVLAQSTETPEDLAIACLLHDVGKARYRLSIWQRSLAVLVKKIAPSLEKRLSADETLSQWRAPFVVRRHHPKWGAKMMCQTLCQKRAVWLVAHHADALERWQNHPHYALLERLKRADDAN